MIPTTPLLQVLLALLSYISSSAAEVICDDTGDPDDVPPLADCLEILPHLPSFSPNYLAPGGSHLLSKSDPFLPKAAFLHKDCVIVTSFQSSGRHFDAWQPSEDQRHIATLLNAIGNSYGDVEDAARTEANFFRVWSLIKSFARQVVEQCVGQQRHVGDGEGQVQLPGLPDALLYEVSVMKAEDQSWVEGYHISTQSDMRRALEWGQRPGWDQDQTWFDQTFFDV